MLPELWQDWLIMVGQAVLFLALIPSILSPHKPSAWTSAITAFILTLFAISFWTLGLPFSTGSTLLAAGAWYVLLVQEILRIRSRH